MVIKRFVEIEEVVNRRRVTCSGESADRKALKTYRQNRDTQLIQCALMLPQL
jgi:hypothetical protein